MASSERNPVVLIHGWGGNFRDTWQKPGIDALLEDIGRSVVGFNLLGHGERDKPHDPEAYENLHLWLLENLPDEHPVVDVVGFSLGALSTLRALIEMPSRFGKIILAGIGDGVFVQSPPEGNKRIVDALEGRAPEDDTFAQTFAHYGQSGNNDVAALTAIMKRKPSEPLEPSQLADVPNEVLVVIGDKDFAGPSQKLADAFPNGRLIVLKNTDHFATTDSFSFIDEILDFMA
jgi:pimeloyl-ACP methyl ester carboxylesterase